MTKTVDTKQQSNNNAGSNKLKPLPTVTRQMYGTFRRIEPTESETALAYGMARDFADRNLTRAEAEILIKQFVPATKGIDFTNLLEKAFTVKQAFTYPPLEASRLANYCLEMKGENIKVRGPQRHFIFWNGSYWEQVQGEEKVVSLVKKTLGELIERLPKSQQSNYKAWLENQDHQHQIIAAIRQQADKVPEEKLGVNPDLLLVKNGVYSLDKKELMAIPRERFVTDACQCQADFAEPEKSALWENRVWDFCAGDKALMVYLQMLFGYCLCHATNILDKIIIIHNQGQNGGSLFLDLITRIMGSYVGILPAAALSPRSAVIDDFSYLRDKRMLLIHDADLREPWEPNRLLALARNKTISGWNHHQQKWVDFALNGKLVIETNYVPEWLTKDDQIASQVIVIPLADSCIRDHRQNIAKLVCDFDTENILGWLIKGYELFVAAKGKIEMPPFKPAHFILK